MVTTMMNKPNGTCGDAFLYKITSAKKRQNRTYFRFDNSDIIELQFNMSEFK